MGIANSTGAVKSSAGVTQVLFGDFNFYLFIYIMFAIVVEIAAIAYAMRSQQYIMLAIFLPISLYIFLVYGTRWFGADGIYGNTTVPWPPAINSCPDFLTSYVVAATGSNPAIPGCVDTIGVSRNGGFTRSPTGTPSNPPPSGTPISSGQTSTGGPSGNATNFTGFFPTNIPGEKPATLCARLQTAGLTWEGIWDGENCFSGGSVISGKGGAYGSGSCN